MPTFTLKQWLSWITRATQTSHPNPFEQVSKAAAHLKLTHFDVPVIAVTGTNGKGSCVAVLESILTEAGYKVGAYTSPHLFEFNERVRISGKNVSDQLLSDAFEIIYSELYSSETIAGEFCSGTTIPGFGAPTFHGRYAPPKTLQHSSSVSSVEPEDFLKLNFFSWITLAALLIFKKEACDVIILEVGIGGRLDVTNVVENDVVVITTVGLDHCELLGDSIEKIALEKAGLIKKNKAVVFGGDVVPQAVVDRAREMGASFYGQHITRSVIPAKAGIQRKQSAQSAAYSKSLDPRGARHSREGGNPVNGIVDSSTSGYYFCVIDVKAWSWRHETTQYNHLPIPKIFLPNAASAIMALEHLKLTVSEENIRTGLSKVFLPCRCQVILGDITIILDVAHNEQSAELLAKKIIELNPKKVFAVFSALGRKDIGALLRPLKLIVHQWFVAPMQDPESATMGYLSQVLSDCDFVASDSISKVYEAAQSMAEQGDLIVVFGSFRMFNELKDLIL